MSVVGLWSRGPEETSLPPGLRDAFAPLHWQRAHVELQADRVALMSAGAVRGVHAKRRGGALLCGDLVLHEREVLAETLGVDPSSNDDAELALEAYARFGPDFLARLVGEFGFALWDPSRRRLLLARDPGGARPLFYTLRHGHVAFASQPRCLLLLAGVSSRLDERWVLDYLGELPGDERATLHADVRRLPPASYLLVTEAGAREAQYYDVTRTPELRLASEAEYPALLRDALRTAVACRLRGRSRVGVMLSGGLDSSSMTALAAAEAGGQAAPLATISAVFPSFPACDERSFQAAVVAAARSQHTEVMPDPLGAAGDFARLRNVFADPSFIGPHWLSWSVAEAASKAGVATLLTGIDGDRVVCHGAGRYADLARSHDYWTLFKELQAVDDFTWSRRLRVGVGQALITSLPDRAVPVLERLDPRQLGRFGERLQLLRPEALRRHSVRERLRQLPLRPRSGRDDHARSLLAPDRNWDVELLDQLGAGFDIDFVQPFFDRRVMELCFSFPSSQKRQQGWSRFVLRQAMRGLVPDVVLARRRDASFDGPYAEWARGWLRRDLASSPLSLAPIADYVVEPQTIEMINKIDRSSASWTVDFAWRCVILSRWLASPG